MVWLGLVGSRPLAHPVPYLPQTIVEAVPKYISGRTSYLRVRLAFHLYPQLIPAFCTRHGFGPSLGITRASAWPWVAHPVSGLIQTTSRASWKLISRFRRWDPSALRLDFARRLHLRICLRPLSALFGLAFASAPGLVSLNLAAKINSSAHSSIGTQSPAQGGLPRLVGLRFQVYFTPRMGYFSPFPHGTGSLSVAKST